jgi:predicted protein tyrosine phosphatase
MLICPRLISLRMKVLFICNQNQNRSRTAESIFAARFQTRSAGLYNDTPVTARELQWADCIVVMEDEQRKEISMRFPREYLSKRIITLDIPDTYHCGQPELVSKLKHQMEDLF